MRGCSLLPGFEYIGIIFTIYGELYLAVAARRKYRRHEGKFSARFTACHARLC